MTAQTQLGGDRDSAQCQGRDIRALPAATHTLFPVARGMLEASKASPGSALLTHTFWVCTGMDTATCTTPCGSHSHSGSPPFPRHSWKAAPTHTGGSVDR